MERLEIRLESSEKTCWELKEVVDKIIDEVGAKRGYFYIKGNDTEKDAIFVR